MHDILSEIMSFCIEGITQVTEFRVMTLRDKQCQYHWDFNYSDMSSNIQANTLITECIFKVLHLYQLLTCSSCTCTVMVSSELCCDKPGTKGSVVALVVTSP